MEAVRRGVPRGEGVGGDLRAVPSAGFSASCSRRGCYFERPSPPLDSVGPAGQ